MITMTFSSLVACKREQSSWPLFLHCNAIMSRKMYTHHINSSTSNPLMSGTKLVWELVPHQVQSLHHSVAESTAYYYPCTENSRLLRTCTVSRPTCNLVNVSWCVQWGLDFSAGLKNLRYIWPHCFQCKQKKFHELFSFGWPGPTSRPAFTAGWPNGKLVERFSLLSSRALVSCALHDAMVRAGIRGFTLKVVAFFSFKVRLLFWPVFYTFFY
jgi:hypothetical protein